MHSAKSITVMALLAAAVVGAALFLSPGEEPGGDRVALNPGLDKRINDVKTLTVRDAASEIVIENGGTGWVLTSSFGYPADAGAVRALLLSLAGARIVEPKTARPELYHRLGVTDISEQGSAAVQVIAEDASGDTVASVLIGKEASAEDRYVRRAGEAQSLRVTGVGAVSTDPKAWLKSTIIDVARDEITGIEILNDGERIDLIASETGEMALQEIPAGKKITYQFALNDFASTIAGLKLDAVRPADGIDFGGGLNGTVVMTEGLELEFDTALADNDTWFRFTAMATDSASARSKTRAREMNQRWEGWAYRLSDLDLARLGKPKADLLEDVATGSSTSTSEQSDGSTANGAGADARPEDPQGLSSTSE